MRRMEQWSRGTSESICVRSRTRTSNKLAFHGSDEVRRRDLPNSGVAKHDTTVAECLRSVCEGAVEKHHTHGWREQWVRVMRQLYKTPTPPVRTRRSRASSTTPGCRSCNPEHRSTLSLFNGGCGGGSHCEQASSHAVRRAVLTCHGRSNCHVAKQGA